MTKIKKKVVRDGKGEIHRAMHLKFIEKYKHAFDKIVEIEQRCEKATPGPWFPLGERYPNNNSGKWTGLIANEAKDAKVLPRDGFERSEDTQFIAHAREDIPYLLGVIKEQAATIQEYLEMLKDKGVM